MDPRHLFAVLAGLLLVTTAPLAAHAASPIEITAAPMMGWGFYDDSIGMEDGLVFQGRVGLVFLQHFGVEGMYGKGRSERALVPDRDFPLDTWGLDLIYNFLPNELFNPYLAAGWAQFDLDDPMNEKTELNGWEYGGGMKIRIWQGGLTRFDFRLDARDVTLKNDTPLPEAGRYRHHFMLTAGFNLSLLGPYQDTDGDGIPDSNDACPNSRRGALVNSSGCEPDTDGDGVPDALDRCAYTPPGVLVDELGCPYDADGDGVVDGVDQCPGTPENAVVDSLGCPTDSDADGVVDGVDQCPGTPVGVRVNPQGCPRDSDGDGVFDGLDQCEGTPAGVPVDASGCPVPTSDMEEEFMRTGTLRLQSVHFSSGSSTLRGSSYPVLDEVADILLRWPHLRVEISGHTDAQGDEGMNQSLSRRRASAVLDYLVENYYELTVERFFVQGYGESQPMATNDTSEGRALNRRVEFKIMNMKN